MKATIQPPFCITSRLMCGVKIGDGEISIGYSKRPGREGRDRYQYYIDIPGCGYSADDLQSGCGGGSIAEGMSSLLAFLGAAAESHGYRLRTGRQTENEELFSPNIVEWAYTWEDEISMVKIQIEENPSLITEA